MPLSIDMQRPPVRQTLLHAHKCDRIVNKIPDTMADAPSNAESASEEPLDEKGVSHETDEKRKKLEIEKAALIAAVAAGRFDTLQQKVAWILNHFPATRDSDITLQLQFWDSFAGQQGQQSFPRQALYDLPRLTSLARARATIQNTYDLFKATEAVRSKRGTLSEEERQKAREHRPEAPTLTVYMDESGKNGVKLIVGSLWFLFAPELLGFIFRINLWKKERGFNGEFHFNEISKGNFEHYMSLVEFLKECSATVSFKALSVERHGLKHVDQSLRELFYLLLEKGVRHEHDTGRAILPRELSVWKDQEEPSADKLFLEDLRVKLLQASATQFNGQLMLGDFRPIDSEDQPLVQIADLYTGAINRILNSPKGDHPKDLFARSLLEAFGYPDDKSESVLSGDMTVHMSL